MVAARWTPCRPCWTWPACARPGKAGSSWKSWTAAIASRCCGARKGCWAQARWDDGDAPAHRHTAWIESGADYPSYQTAALPERGAAESPRSLTLTLDIEPLPAPALEADAARIARRVTPADYAQAGRRAGTRYRGVPDAVATPEPARRSGLGGELGTVAQRARAVDEPVGRGARSLPGSQNRIEQRIPAGMALPLFSTLSSTVKVPLAASITRSMRQTLA